MLAGAIELMNRIHKDFRYDTTVTDATTPVDRVFEIRAGVCQDLAHVGIAAMRSHGPAGALCLRLSADPAAAGQAAPAGRRCQPCLVLASGRRPSAGSIWTPPTMCWWAKAMSPSSWGRDYGDVAPVAGIILGGHDHVVDVGVDVIPVDPDSPQLPHISARRVSAGSSVPGPARSGPVSDTISISPSLPGFMSGAGQRIDAAIVGARAARSHACPHWQTAVCAGPVGRMCRR